MQEPKMSEMDDERIETKEDNDLGNLKFGQSNQYENKADEELFKW